jgi:hypothetical protein
MRLAFGLLLAVLCISSGKATDRTAWLSTLAGVPIRIFELRSPEVPDEFRAFLAKVPMTNDRPVPAALIDDTVASLVFLKSSTPADEPSYFVASWIHKTPLVALPEASRARYLERYGETVYPQRVCPVFLDRGDAGVPKLLGTAVNLPTRWFSNAVGTAEGYDRLFGLTEASHCGFIARELVEPTVIPPGTDRRELRTFLEALGDYEAIAVFRAVTPRGELADEADVLYAARLLGALVAERESPYTPIPALLHEYGRIGPQAAHLELERILRSVRHARSAVRAALDAAPGGDPTLLSLADVEALLRRAEANGGLALEDPLAARLVSDLGPALRLLQGDATVRTVPASHADVAYARPALVTFTGAGVGPLFH